MTVPKEKPGAALSFTGSADRGASRPIVLGTLPSRLFFLMVHLSELLNGRRDCRKSPVYSSSSFQKSLFNFTRKLRMLKESHQRSNYDTSLECNLGSKNQPNEHKQADPHFFWSQFRSVAQSCLTLCDPVRRSTPGLSVHQHCIQWQG